MTKSQLQVRIVDRNHDLKDQIPDGGIFARFLSDSRSIFSKHQDRLPDGKLFYLTALFLLSSLFCLTGCGSSNNPTPTSYNSNGSNGNPQNSPVTPNEDQNSPNATAVQLRNSKSGPDLPPLKITPGLTADSLIRQMAAVYAKCKVYSDNAYIEILYDKNDTSTKERQTRRYPCSVTLKKPNQIHLAVRDGELFSDGKFLRSRIHLPAFEDLYREQKAPFLFSSVMEFYPDIRLASAMQLDVPPSICWAPPQLIFLLVKKPLKTFLPNGAEMTLLEPAYARIKKNKTLTDPKNVNRNDNVPSDNSKSDTEKEEEFVIPCDRIQITSDSGKITLWISRKDNVLIRMEFPLEQLAVPDDVNRISKINLEIPNPLVSNDLKDFQHDEIFTPTGLEKLKKVNEFLPSEIVFLGKPFPSVNFKSLVTGFPDIHTDRPDDKYRLIWLFDKKSLESVQFDSYNNQKANPGNRLLTEFNSILTTFGEEPQLQIIPACMETEENFNTRLLMAGYANLNLATSVYRLMPDKADKITLSQIPIPSFILLDNKGIVQRIYRPTINRFRFQTDMKNLLTRQDLYIEELSRYQNNIKIFQEILHQADVNDIYRTVTDSSPMEPEVKPQAAPQKMKLQKIWTISRLHDPGNPLFVPAKKLQNLENKNISANKSPNDQSLNKTTDNKQTNDKSVTNKPTFRQTNIASSPSVSESSATENKQKNKTIDSLSSSATTSALNSLASKRSWRDFIHSDLLLIPSDGNSINILSLDGKVLKTLESTITGDEPITFIRFAESSEGKRFYAASALLETQKIHCFNENFEKITTINIGTLHNQRVADLQLADITGSPDPELLLALCGDSTDNTAPIDGLYAVDMHSRNILWKDEEVNTPYRIAIESLSNGKKNLLALNHYEGNLGNIIVDDLMTGERRRVIPSEKNPAKKNFSMLWLGNTLSENQQEVSVFMDQLDISKSFFAGISTTDGQVLWQIPISEKNLDRRMERIVTGDINGDGKDEWILPYRDGTILFLDSKGKLLDKLHVGRIITGVCLARTSHPIEIETSEEIGQSIHNTPSSDSVPTGNNIENGSAVSSNDAQVKTKIQLNKSSTLLIITGIDGVTAWKVDW